jgi:hypothetical protein
VLSQRQHGLRMYKRQEAEAQAVLSKPSRRAEMTKSELRHDFEKAWQNTAKLPAAAAVAA